MSPDLKRQLEIAKPKIHSPDLPQTTPDSLERTVDVLQQCSSLTRRADMLGPDLYQRQRLYFFSLPYTLALCDFGALN